MSNNEQAVEASRELVRSVRSTDFQAQAALALPENVPPRRFVRATLTALMANPDLALSDHSSVLNALMRSAQDGLMPDGYEAALVLYKGKAQYLPMIGGLRKIAAEHGWSLSTTVVYANDAFDFELGLDERLEHRPARGNRGDMVAAYAVGRHRDGRRMFEVMQADEIAKVRKSSRAADRGPWVDWTERMWEKTVGRKLFKRLPLDPNDKRVARLIAVDELEPGDAAARLYGPPAHAVAPASPPAEPPRELEAGSPAPGAPAADAATEARSAGEPGEPAAGGSSVAAAAGDPGDEPVVDVELETEVAADLEARLVAARDVTFTRGANEGKRLGDVARAPGAMTWFGWALNNLETFDDEVANAVRLVAEHDVPDAWARHTERGAA